MTRMSEVEQIAIKSLRATTNYTTFEIATKLIESRYPAEYELIHEAVKKQ